MSDIYTPTTSGERLPGGQTTAVTAEPISAIPPFQPAEIEKQYKAVGAAKGAEAEKKRQFTEATRAEARRIEQIYEPQLAEAAKTPEFKPSQATAGELTALFGMIGAMGALGGKGSYASALGAMNAMGGMLKGYNQGRKDLFDQEKAIYDKKIQENKLHFDRINQAYERALKAAPNNLSAAQSQLERELTGLGANVLAQQSKLEGMSKSYEMWRLARNNYEMNQARLSRNLRSPQTAIDDEVLNSTANAIANYAQKPPGLRDANRTQILAKVRQINPDWQEAGYGQRDIAYRNWINPNGTGTKQLGAFNTVANHLETLQQLGNALENSNTPAINAAINFFKTNLGHPEVTNFNTAKQAVSAEIVRAITGAGGAVADRQEAERAFSAAASPDQLSGAIKTAKDLISGRLETAKAIYETGTGRKDFEDLLPPKVKSYFAEYLKGGAPSSNLPKVGEVRDGYKFLGGDPSSQSSWQKVE